jgi:hypothetical protein
VGVGVDDFVLRAGDFAAHGVGVDEGCRCVQYQSPCTYGDQWTEGYDRGEDGARTVTTGGSRN